MGNASNATARRPARTGTPGPRLLAIGLLAAAMTGGLVLAQSDQGQISGTVRDESGAVLPGATVTAVNDRTAAQQTTVTNEKGFFIVPRLKPSVYTISISMPSFAEVRYTAVEVVVGEARTLDVKLKIASLNETIKVVSDADPVIDTSSARIGANVNPREVGGLPINGRQLSQLYLQAPGSLNSGSGTFSDIRFSGRAVEQNILRYDGVEGSAIIDASPGNLNGEVPSPFRLQSSLENVQEFRVESSSYPAEFGTGTGGQISVISKSGSNQFHGAVFEYLRNDVLDARNFFDLSTKSPLRLNQFGGSFGGPIAKDKAFFFFSYEGYRLRSGINAIEAVPSVAAAARAVPAVAPLLAAFRAPNATLLPGASNSPDFDIAQLQANTTVSENAVGLRLDYKPSVRNSFYARYYRDQGFNDQPEGVTGRRTVVRAVPQNAVLAWQSTLTNTVVNEFKLGYNAALTRINGFVPALAGLDLSAVTINISGSVANTGIAGQGGSTGIAIPGGLVRQNSATNGRGAPYTPYSVSFIDNLSWIRGSHNVKLGTEIRMIRMYTDRLGGTTYTFANLADFLANRLQQVQYLGDVSAPSAFNGNAAGNRLAEQEYYIGFAQDEWKLHPSVTLNYGLRYEFYRPLREADDLNVQFDTERGVLLPSDQAFFKTLKTNFAPRVALAWSPRQGRTGMFGGGRTVFRLGFGLNYGPGQVEDQIQPIESDRISSTISGGTYPIDPAAVTSNFINNPDNRQFQPRAYTPRYRVPERIYQYSASLQQELPGRLVLTAGYVGSQGRNLFLRNITNRITEVRTNSDPTRAAIVLRQFDIVRGDTILRPYAEVDVKESGGSDSYNAMQLALARRFNAGVVLNAQYTLSRSFGNTSGSNEALTAANPFDYEYDRGYNAFDVRHTFNLSALYELPFGKGKRYLSGLRGFGGALVGGWEAGTILNGRSGLPIDVRVTRPDVVYVDAAGRVFGAPAAGLTAVINTPGGGASRGVRRPDLVAGVDPYLGADRAFLNPAAFAIPKTGSYGNMQRGAVHGPAFSQFDLILAKRFRFKEGASVEFRTEIFNVLNTTNFANPPATLPNVLGTGANQLQPGQPYTASAAGNFGIMNRTVERTVGLGTNRQIQFALRVAF